MESNKANGLNELRDNVAKMEKDLGKTLNFNMERLKSVIKEAEYSKEKKIKIKKKSATMMLSKDCSHVKIVFDNIADNVSFFEGKKKS